MNHRITLLERLGGTSAAGRPSTTWVDVATIWADVRFQSGAEVVRGGADMSIKRASIRVRTRKDVDAGWRVRYAGEVYEIKGPPLPDADRQFMFLVCEAAK
jgi:SPP1 family predicted phage head-tail adaptor